MDVQGSAAVVRAGGFGGVGTIREARGVAAPLVAFVRCSPERVDFTLVNGRLQFRFPIFVKSHEQVGVVLVVDLFVEEFSGFVFHGRFFYHLSIVRSFYHATFDDGVLAILGGTHGHTAALLVVRVKLTLEKLAADVYIRTEDAVRTKPVFVG